ncbi:MAG: hypothetical protein ACD_17C00464G0002 [uncultured bacterium]|nr:MAG: hypothetical protein ACD_17C00464G0002 [uncultured bacterium]OGN66405.1 MAG: hypothetical protein A2978_03780 [Chlamydiae bacterium RIFCSPLOWO2_01_FULL_44_52]
MKCFLFASLLVANLAFAAPTQTSQENTTSQLGGFFQEGDTKWYVGAGVSCADLFYYKNRQINNITTANFTSNDQDVEDTTEAPSLGYNAFLGYTYNEFLDVEFKVAQIMRPFQDHFRSDASGSDDSDDVYSGTTKLYFLSFGPYLLIHLPMYKIFTPYFRFGMVTDLVTFKITQNEDRRFHTDNTLESGSQKQSFWVEKFNVGIGVKSRWGNCVVFKLEYETPTTNTIVGRTTTHSAADFYIPGILSASLLCQF